MSHMTNKKKQAREKNARLRGMSGFNTGTRTMGKPNTERKALSHTKSWRFLEA